MLGKRPKGLSEKVFVHDLALVESSQIGDGTRIWGFAHVCKDAVVGADCNICERVYIESGVRIGSGVKIKNGISVWDGVTIEDEVFLGPNVVFTNDLKPRAFVQKDRSDFDKTLVKRGATLGAGSVIVAGIEIGEYAFIGAGAVVTRSVPDYGLVLGNPAKSAGYICKQGLHRYPNQDAARECSDCKG